MDEKRVNYLREKLDKAVGPAMFLLRNELKFSREETNYIALFDANSRSFILKLHSRIFKKIKKAHAELNYDCGLTFYEDRNEVIISTDHDQEGIRILDVILDKKVDELLKEKDELFKEKNGRIIKNVEKTMKVIGKLLPKDVKFHAFYNYKKEEYFLAIKTKMLRVVFHNKSVDKLLENSTANINAVLNMNKKKSTK